MKMLREIRQASGLTQIELAKRASLDRTRVSLWEAGYVDLSPVEEERIRIVLLDAAQDRIVELQGAILALGTPAGK